MDLRFDEHISIASFQRTTRWVWFFVFVFGFPEAHTVLHLCGFALSLHCTLHSHPRSHHPYNNMNAMGDLSDLEKLQQSLAGVLAISSFDDVLAIFGLLDM